MSPLLSSTGRSVGKLIEAYDSSNVGKGFGSSDSGGGGGATWLGDTQSNPATSAQAILAANPERLGMDGWYWIKTSSGMASAQQLWCNMTVDNKGWMRFWWYGKYDVDGSLPVNSDFEAQDQFGIADISTITPTAAHGRGRIPAGETISGIMARGKSSEQNTNAGKLRWARWDTTSSGWNGNVAGWMRAGMQSGSTAGGGSGTRVAPTGWDMQDTVYITESGNCDAWYYQNEQNVGWNSFHFDDDTGWHRTVFGAGREGSGNNGCDFCTNAVGNSTTNPLALYWR